MAQEDTEGTDIEGEGSGDSEEESEETSSGSGTEEGDEDMQRAGVLAGIVKPTEKIWKTEAADAIRTIAKGMCIAAKGYDRLARKVQKTPLEALAPWVKRTWQALVTSQFQCWVQGKQLHARGQGSSPTQRKPGRKSKKRMKKRWLKVMVTKGKHLYQCALKKRSGTSVCMGIVTTSPREA